MGTFQILGADLVTTNSNPASTYPWGGGAFPVNNRLTSNAALLAGINSLVLENPSLYCGFSSVPSFSGGPGTWLIRFAFSHAAAVISLDGGSPISFDSLPPGLRILTATLSIRNFQPTNMNPDPGNQLFYQRNVLTESGNLGQTSSHSGLIKTFAYDFSPTGFGTFLDVLNDGFGIRVPMSVGGSVGQGFVQANIIGTYDTLAFTYTMSPAAGSSVDAGPDGNLITISSVLSDPNHLKLNHLTISVACGAITIVDQTETLFTFYLPVACDGAGSTAIMATGDGTQFSGSVSLGSLIILLTDHSGIYTLVPGKSNDTLYSSLRDGTTKNVKIPNPFIKTGFIGG